MHSYHLVNSCCWENRDKDNFEQVCFTKEHILIQVWKVLLCLFFPFCSSCQALQAGAVLGRSILIGC